MENVLNVILTMYSSQTVHVSQKMSSVKKWMNSELASSVWIATTTLRNTKSVSRKNLAVFITKWENAPLVMNLSPIIMENAELKDVSGSTKADAINASILSVSPKIEHVPLLTARDTKKTEDVALVKMDML